mgnify:FL=1
MEKYDGMMQRPTVGVTSADAAFKPNSDVNGFRRRRFARFIPLLAQSAQERSTVRVLDIGGTKGYWQGVQDMWQGLDLQITLLNINATASAAGPFTVLGGDARAVQFPDNSFDVVHSNSVIEHVGAWSDIQAMAGEVQRLAPRYFVQTPNFWFPFEPHFRSVGFHWLPAEMRARRIMRKRLGHRPKQDNFHDAMALVQSVQLLIATQMRALFHGAAIEREYVFGLTKSLMAIK